jgi:hypothetical protein
MRLGGRFRTARGSGERSEPRIRPICGSLYPQQSDSGPLPHFAAEWAWAMDTPFKWMKQVASHRGGTAHVIHQRVLSDAEAAKFLARGIKLQSERNEILHNYIEKLKRAVPASVALRAWEVENKLRAEASALYLQNVPFVTQ